MTGPAPLTSQIFSPGTYQYLSAERSETQLVFLFTPNNFPLSPTYRFVLTGSFVLVDGNGDPLPLGTQPQATAITGLARYVDLGGTSGALIDQITNLSALDPAVFVGFGGGSPAYFFAGDSTYQGFAGGDILSDALSVDTDDVFYGNDGNDVISSGLGRDTIYGGGGDDALGGGVPNSAGRLIYGGNGRDTIAGNAFGDSLFGGKGNDLIQSVAGDDLLNGGAGIDTMEGGDGNDVFIVDNSADQPREGQNRPGETDTVRTSVSFSVAALTNGYRGIEVLDGGSATSGVTLTGSSFTIRISGGAQNDTLNGDPATGVEFDGRGGDDTMNGGNAGDTYHVDGAGDVISDTGGTDTVLASADYTLGAGQALERLVAAAGLTGLALTGNEFANTLVGRGGDDTLSGGDGFDLLTGGLGADSFVLQTSAASRDRLMDFTPGTDQLLLSEALFGELDGPGLGFADRFVVNTTGRASDGGTADTRVIYDSTSGKLYFDANGTGAGQSALVAILTDLPTLTATDFLIL